MLRDPTHAVQVKWALLSKDLYWWVGSTDSVAQRRVQCVAVLNTVRILRVVQKLEEPLAVPQDSLRPLTVDQH